MSNEPDTSYEFGAFRLIPSERQLLRENQSITLPPKAFQALAILVQNHGHAVKKKELIETLWPDSFVEESNLNHYVSLVRKALGDGTNGERYIETLPKLGYRFRGDVRETNAQTESLLIHRHTRTRVVFKEEQSESLKTVSSRQTAVGGKPSLLRRVALAASAVLICAGAAAGYFGYIRSARSRAAKSPTNLSLSNSHESSNPAARDAYWQGRYFYHKRTTTDVRLGEQYFQKAIAADPGFALAYVGLADSYLILDPAKAEGPLRKALDLDNSLGEAHASLGFMRMFYHWDWHGAQAEFEQAVALSPNYSTAHQWYALYLASQARFDDAKREMSKAIEIDSHSANLHADFAQILYFAREYNDAITECHKALELEPNFIFAHQYLSSIYAKKNMYAEAVEEVLMADRTAGRLSDEAINSKRQIFMKAGWAEFLRTQLKQVVPGESPVITAGLYTMLGEKDRALAELERARDANDFFLTFIKVDPAYDDLRSDARFQNLLRRMNLE
jgi:DNA-binding winged helix-turn-helix (wHTH) protein/Tfp pilus assembly protein PilF